MESVCANNVLKAEVDDAYENTVEIFSTNKTLNERFTPKEPRFVFIVNNGYTRPYRNNCFKEKVVIENPTTMSIHKRFSMYLQENAKTTGKAIERNQLEQEFSEPPNKRRIVVMPVEQADGSSDKETKISAVSLTEYRNSDSEVYEPVPCRAAEELKTPEEPKRSRRRKRKRKSKSKRRGAAFLATYAANNQCFKNSDSAEPILFSPFFSPKNQYFNEASSRWRCPPPSTAALESEKFLNDEEDARLGLIF